MDCIPSSYDITHIDKEIEAKYLAKGHKHTRDSRSQTQALHMYLEIHI